MDSYKNPGVKISAFFVIIGLITVSCTAVKALIYVNKRQIKPIHYNYNGRSLIFVPMVHVGEESFYNSLKDSIVKWKSLNYTIFYEQIISDNETMRIDSLTYVQVKRKARKIVELSKYSRKNYALRSGKILKNKVVQPEYIDMGITGSDINADINLQELVDEYERLYGKIQLDSCDFVIPINSYATCRRLQNNLDPIIYDFRNRELARKISESELDKIVVLYGASHIRPVIKILRNKEND